MDYEIIRSSRRTVSLSVKDGRLTVRAPYGTSQARLSEIVRSHMNWIEKQLSRQSIPRLKDKPLSDDEIKELKRKARKILTEKTQYYADIMGIKHGRITITGAKTRFGSCSSNGNISYSYLLLLYPEEAVDYVVVHELSHIMEMNHSRAFYNIVASVMPDYKERRKLLKQ
ncbi:MAG: M48 family metallopeptidase [Clostridia bacterium]|nr:M48 family metallopeptidase [Clostridia bacterium]